MAADSSTSRACGTGAIERTRCGAARPTKAISPVCATAVPVARASSKMSTMRSGASGRPRLWAVASPRDRPFRAFAASGTLVVVAFYLIAQMVGAGQLIKLLFGLDYWIAVVLVGGLMMIYVLFGGMTATTWA